MTLNHFDQWERELSTYRFETVTRPFEEDYLKAMGPALLALTLLFSIVVVLAVVAFVEVVW